MNFKQMTQVIKKMIFIHIIVRVGLLSLTASSEGITLTAASNIIFAEVKFLSL